MPRSCHLRHLDDHGDGVFVHRERTAAQVRRTAPCKRPSIFRIRPTAPLLGSIAYLSWVHFYSFITFFNVFTVVVQVMVVHILDPTAHGTDSGLGEVRPLQRPLRRPERTQPPTHAYRYLPRRQAETEWERIARSFRALMALRKANAVNSAMNRVNLGIFLVSNFVLFFIEVPVVTVVCTAILAVLGIIS